MKEGKVGGRDLRRGEREVKEIMFVEVGMKENDK